MKKYEEAKARIEALSDVIDSVACRIQSIESDIARYEESLKEEYPDLNYNELSYGENYYIDTIRGLKNKLVFINDFIEKISKF